MKAAKSVKAKEEEESRFENEEDGHVRGRSLRICSVNGMHKCGNMKRQNGEVTEGEGERCVYAGGVREKDRDRGVCE